MAGTFRTIVGVIAIVVFIALMVTLYYAAQARGKNVRFPPNVPPCPDYFVANPAGSGCLLPPGLGNRDVVLDMIRAKNASLATQLAGGQPLQIPSGSLCAFTQNNGISWNGVSNVHPCADA
jgi:hypothetical protein